MTCTLVIPEHLTKQLHDAVAADLESGAVLLARAVTTPSGELRLLARSLHWVPDDAYILREADELQIASEGYVPALAAAEADDSVAMWVHTHPGNGACPKPSRHDEIVDTELADVFRLRSGAEWYGAVVLAHHEGSVRFCGHIESEAEHFDIDRIWLTGRRFTLAHNWLHTQAALPDLFDRNIRAFGGDIQRVVSDLRVAIVGCGGTGSAVSEQLVRLGARHLTLFDSDVLSASNLTRVYGSFPSDVGRPKVDVLADHLRRIAPDIQAATVNSKITVEATARKLLDADIIFGCTDDNAGRLVLSRIASYFLTPVIDCGVLLSSAPGGILEGIDGRVTLLAPGAACLICRRRVDTSRAAAELMEPEEQRRLADEGYAPGLPGVEPAVVAFTTQVAAAAVGELLERLVHYGPEPAPTELLIRAHERESSANAQLPNERHYCHPDANKLGLGMTEPFLEQTWQA